jgi:tetratricopeptide (TPR) repeat protein
MRGLVRRLVIVPVVAALLGLPVAWGKEPPPVPGTAEVAQATAAAAANRLAEAGTLLAKAVTLAVKAKSLEGEERAAEALETILDGLEADASRNAGPPAYDRPRPGRDKARELVGSALQGLDPKHHGVFVSAHALALGLVLDVVALGDDLHLAAAAAALTAYAGTSQAGVAGPVLARLAQAVVAARAGDPATAPRTLAYAAAELEARGWHVPALYARLELAMQLLAAADADGALKTLKLAVARLPREPDLPNVREWLQAVGVRAKDAPADLLESFQAGADHLLGASSGPAGGRGGRGAQQGGGDVSPIGKALTKWPPGKPFALVRRTATGFQCDLPSAEAQAAEVPLRPGQLPWEWEGSGVTLLLAGPAVALRMLDLTGLRSQPSGRSRPSRAWAFYWLAEGETWGATKLGVEISGRPAPFLAR